MSSITNVSLIIHLHQVDGHARQPRRKSWLVVVASVVTLGPQIVHLVDTDLNLARDRAPFLLAHLGMI